jgi:hypothetical protein
MPGFSQDQRHSVEPTHVHPCPYQPPSFIPSFPLSLSHFVAAGPRASTTQDAFAKEVKAQHPLFYAQTSPSSLPPSFKYLLQVRPLAGKGSAQECRGRVAPGGKDGFGSLGRQDDVHRTPHALMQHLEWAGGGGVIRQKKKRRRGKKERIM